MKHLIYTITRRQGDLHELKPMLSGPLATCLGGNLMRAWTCICNHYSHLHVYMFVWMILKPRSGPPQWHVLRTAGDGMYT